MVAALRSQSPGARLMEPTELLRLVGEQLDSIGCQRFTTGSVASMIAVQRVAEEFRRAGRTHREAQP